MTQHVHTSRASQRRVVAATIVGTTIEWYDFFIYAVGAGLVFTELFFKPAGEKIGLLLSFGTIGLSFLFRPLGAFLAGHYGDKYGRRNVLVVTLVMMGLSTTLIGVLPTYAQFGIAAPILLIFLRLLQGISAGGEWGGAVLMAVEHAPKNRRGLIGACPQIGVPIGMLLASGITALMTGVISPGAAFLEWGWRVPFLVSIVMIVIGYYVRRTVEESPVFVEIAQRKQQAKVPIVELFRKHSLLVVLAALTFMGTNAAGYMTTGGFITNYATNPAGPLGLDRTAVLLAVTGSSVLWLIFTFTGGVLSDTIGRRKVYVIGYVAQLLTIFPMFALVNSGDVWMLFIGISLFTIGLGFCYGPQAAWFSELFPASVRFSGVSISYALGAICGGAFAPLIAAWLVQETGGTFAVGVYLTLITLVAFAAVLMLRDRPGIDLGIDNQAEQEVGATVFDKRATPAGRRDQALVM